MLKIEHLYKTFNPNTVNEKKALIDVNLQLNQGDFVTVIGSNGAGKSTLLNAIAGLWSIDEGHIYIDDQEITDLPDYQRAKYIGRVFQDPLMGSAADMWIEENMALANRRGQKRTLKQGITDQEREEFKSLLKEFDLGLENRLSSKVGLLSGGQRQALTLLMATLRKPELLLLDEHTAALDPKTAKKVLDTTDRLIKKYGLTTFMVTHNMKDALTYGNRLIMMNEGRIILDIDEKEKKNLTVADLLEKFEQAAGGNSLSDATLLSQN